MTGRLGAGQIAALVVAALIAYLAMQGAIHALGLGDGYRAAGNAVWFLPAAGLVWWALGRRSKK